MWRWEEAFCQVKNEKLVADIKELLIKIVEMNGNAGGHVIYTEARELLRRIAEIELGY